MQIAPLRFCHVQKGAFRGLQNMPKSVSAWVLSWTLLGELKTLPILPSWLGSGHPSHTPPHSAVSTNPPSTLAMHPPQFQPDLCLWVHLTFRFTDAWSDFWTSRQCDTINSCTDTAWGRYKIQNGTEQQRCKWTVNEYRTVIDHKLYNFVKSRCCTLQ